MPDNNNEMIKDVGQDKTEKEAVHAYDAAHGTYKAKDAAINGTSPPVTGGKVPFKTEGK
jgi:hypothetical protein